MATANPRLHGSEGRSDASNGPPTRAMHRPATPIYLRPMPECPICRRQYDEQFSVFVPPHSEAFDTIECAKRAAAAWGAAAAAPVILPTIEVAPAPPVAKAVAGAPGRGVAALAALALV